MKHSEIFDKNGIEIKEGDKVRAYFNCYTGKKKAEGIAEFRNNKEWVIRENPKKVWFLEINSLKSEDIEIIN